MRVFQEEIFGPVVSVDSFNERAEPLGSPTTRSTASVPRLDPNMTRASAWGAGSRPGACDELLHQYPAHAAFGGYKNRASARERKMMLDHYQQTKNVLVSVLARRARLLLIHTQGVSAAAWRSTPSLPTG